MTHTDLKKAIQTALADFVAKPLFDAATGLFEALGYKSDRRLRLKPNTPAAFLKQFSSPQRPLRKDHALTDAWRSIEFLFQITDEEIRTGLGNAQPDLFSSYAVWDDSRMESYLFLAIELNAGPYTRTQLATATRAINRLFDMPAMLLFKHGDTLTIAVIHRRLHKRDTAKDVLEKVTLIKDIRFAQPHRAHVEILFDLSLAELARNHSPQNFVQLHEAWRKTLDIQALNKRFFTQLRNWFYWARLHVRFPSGAKKDGDDRDSEALIRLLTRMIFCWFLREKGLIPEDLFSEHTVASLLRDWDPKTCGRDTHGRYYKAILQNLFFATLNTPAADRKFRSARTFHGKNEDYGDQRFFRHVRLLSDSAPVESIFGAIPFLNGGLFENLDVFPGDGGSTHGKEIRVDGFSDVPSKQPLVPDFLFFGADRGEPDIAELLGERGSPKVRGLLRTFHDFKFTIEENTPLEEDIALDPELLGRAFENLLAAVNPETGATARKSTGSYYTPREIVNYMVEEALVRHLLTVLSAGSSAPAELEERLRELASEEQEGHRFGDAESQAIVKALGRLRILDPACGSGAFPMGILHRLVHVLHKLDPDNKRWKATKLASLPPEMRRKAEDVFRTESFDYTRKLDIIKDCIHGVDIQPAAIQISKLRFFLSLVIEQKDNANVRPLPNLETKFICANSLLGLAKGGTSDLFEHQIEEKEGELLEVRKRYFFAADHDEKDRCRTEDRRLRDAIAKTIVEVGGDLAKTIASAVAGWDPYKPDRAADYFDPESMFGVRDGFDITIGNPPYVRADEQSEWNQRQRQRILASKQYETLWEKWDLFVPFIERAYKLLRPGGVSTLIVSDAFCHSKYAQKSQNWFLKYARILRLDFCSDLKIFDAAVHNLIYFFQKADGAHCQPDRRIHRQTFGNVSLLPSNDQASLTYRVFFPEDAVAQVFSCPSVLLTRICYISKGMVVHADEDEARGEFELRDLVSYTKDPLHPKPFVEGKNLERWLPADQKWLEWGTNRAPALFSRPTFPEIYTAPEKLISVDMAAGTGRLRVAYDNQCLFHNHSAWSFVPWHALADVRNNSLRKAARYGEEAGARTDLPSREELEATSRRFSVKYLLGVMNSSTARDFLRANRRSNIHLYPDDWKKLPIPDVPESKQAPIVRLVDKILDAKRASPASDIGKLERELDAKVSALYGLTPEKTKLLEGTAK